MVYSWWTSHTDVVDHETRRGFLQRSQYYLEHTSQSSASGISLTKHCCLNVRDVSTASKIGNSGDATWSTKLWWHHWSAKCTNSVSNYLRNILPQDISLRDAVSTRLWRSYVHSIETIDIRKMFQSAQHFPPGTFKLHFPIPIKAYVFLERSSTW